jgi:predicted thioredoxin/glutaredoxin
VSRRWTRPLLLALAAVYLLGMGFFLGVAFERMRFDGARAAVLDRYREAVRRVHEHQMEIERSQPRR